MNTYFLEAYILCSEHYICQEQVSDMTNVNAPFCLDMEKVCDGVQDCITDEDERDCGKYLKLLIVSQNSE